MKAEELKRVALKIRLMQTTHSQSAICERLCDEEPEFMREFWGKDFMESRGDQSPGYFALCWAESFEEEQGR